ncbi:NAD(P)H-binding protein [Chitinophaga eiseniae]|uniref:NAD(P)H-binding protein n=1 Tax=Chitinophaga eiseniae TaxID=634771 RepID=A0A847SQ12_9BACT|nr:NAD(P)H-binding protein [Chitinophaga eiseniae]NLR79526.1 NAD(P)H-binding protein [Chitinophaga eiseniae]
MKIIVTGSLGNISKPLAQELIAKGHDVTIISSKADKQQAIETLGAKAAIGSVEDVAFLKTIFAGADALYGMTPPNFGATDMIGYYRNIANAYAEAAKSAGLHRIVYLSSYGAHLEKGNGIIRGSYYAEEILNELKDIAVICLRPGYFYYNLYSFLGMIKAQGIIGSNFGGDDKLVMVSPLDIATAAAEELTAANDRSNVRYIASDERTCNEVARLIGEAIGKPGLQWLTFTDEQVKNNMLERGMPAAIADLLVELGAGIHTGLLSSDYDKHKPTPGKVKLQEFIEEFAAAYNHN